MRRTCREHKDEWESQSILGTDQCNRNNFIGNFTLAKVTKCVLNDRRSHTGLTVATHRFPTVLEDSWRVSSPPPPLKLQIYERHSLQVNQRKSHALKLKSSNADFQWVSCSRDLLFNAVRCRHYGICNAMWFRISLTSPASLSHSYWNTLYIKYKKAYN